MIWYRNDTENLCDSSTLDCKCLAAGIYGRISLWHESEHLCGMWPEWEALIQSTSVRNAWLLVLNIQASIRLPWIKAAECACASATIFTSRIQPEPAKFTEDNITVRKKKQTQDSVKFDYIIWTQTQPCPTTSFLAQKASSSYLYVISSFSRAILSFWYVASWSWKIRYIQHNSYITLSFRYISP